MREARPPCPDVVGQLLGAGLLLVKLVVRFRWKLTLLGSTKQGGVSMAVILLSN